jgi:hypothetical protein
VTLIHESKEDMMIPHRSLVIQPDPTLGWSYIQYHLVVVIMNVAVNSHHQAVYVKVNSGIVRAENCVVVNVRYSRTKVAT